MTGANVVVLIFVGVAFVVGLIVGGVLASLKIGEIDAGRFLITYNDPEKNLVSIDLGVDLPDIEKSRYISLEVVVDGKDKKLTKNHKVENS